MAATKDSKKTGKPPGTPKTPAKVPAAKLKPIALALPSDVGSTSPSPAKRGPRPKTVKIEQQKLTFGTGPSPQVDVLFGDVQAGDKALMSQVDKSGEHKQVLTLKAGAMFSLEKTVTIQDGEHAGLQAILIRPAKPFPLMKLSEENRALVFTFYLAPKGIIGESITFDGKRANRAPYSKHYADGSKNRVALLAVCKEVQGAATPLLYNHTFHFESTSQILDFLGEADPRVRAMLHSVEIDNFVRTTSRSALNMLSECPHLTHLHFSAGVFSEDDPGKAAKMFFGEAHKFLSAMGAKKTGRTKTAKAENEANQEEEEVVLMDGVHVLSFGKHAFTWKDENKVRPWAPTLVEEFRENLRGRMNS